uniref:Uncharacterized protein n=1 Tax=Petromyzon marinus TaxID=7757 RepID=S4RR49_PETMA
QVRSYQDVLSKFYLNYTITKKARIKSRKAAILTFLVFVMLVISYTGWVIYTHGYQEFDGVVSSSTAKVKGATEVTGMVMDAADYVISPEEPNSFFVMTNFIETPNQKQGACAEDPDVAPCSSDTDCRAGVTDPEGEGVFTGLCVPINNTTKSCEVNAWCPLPKDSNPPKHNILGSNASYLKSCRYHRQSDPECPIFILGDIVSEAGEDFKELAIEGGVFSIMIEWNCNLDLNEQACKPNYKFRRLDKENRNKTISPGYNFRFPKYYKDAKGIETRTLVKAYGIRFMVEVIGQAGKASLLRSLISLGSGVGLLGMVWVICDLIVLFCCRKSRIYREQLYE